MGKQRKGQGPVRDPDYFRGRKQMPPDDLAEVLKFLVIPVDQMPTDNVIEMMAIRINQHFDIYAKDAIGIRSKVSESRRQLLGETDAV